MKIINSLIQITIFILLPITAWSQNDEECNYAGNQSQMNACAIRDFESADRELNQIYKQLLSSLPKSEKTMLQEKQRAWLKDRDPKCRKEANDEAEGGSMWPMLFDSCRATSTQTRVKQLKQLQK